jgi:hypothetical protein
LVVATSAGRVPREGSGGSGSDEDVAAAAATGTNKPDPATAQIAIIGAGIGGATTALELIHAGFKKITLYEKSDDLVSSTSSMIAVRCVALAPAPHPSPFLG